ncbi:MAG: peptide ABC transporter substrate-binding protein [bacterium]|nr:peptide ABC transporter substrate-binding protein [bacterium]
MIRNIFKIFLSLTKLEKLIIIGAGLVFVCAGIVYGMILISQKTTVIPSYGGTYREGMVEQPVFINPVLASSDVDQDIINLVYSNLYDLSDNIKLAENKLTWNIRLKDNIYWHDGKKLTADDVIFTISTIHDRESRSPLSVTWNGVNAERMSELEIKLTTGAPYVFFEDNLRKLNILPKHIFGDVPLTNWRSSAFNLEPIGSGPFKYVSYKQEKNGFISSYTLERNEQYFGQKPYLDGIELSFFKTEEGAIAAFNMAKIDGLSNVNQTDLNKITRFNTIHELRMPNYYAIFLNQSTNPILKNDNVRSALNSSIPRDELISKIFNGHASVVTGPLPYVGVFSPDQEVSPTYDIEKAIKLLDDSGVKAGEDGSRGKITLVVPNIPYLVATGEIVKQNWERLGFTIEVVVIEPALINSEVIRTRNYDALLFGNALARNPDIISFWHSRERFFPGLNLSLYNNKAADSILESIRQDFNEKDRMRDLASLQSLIIEDTPAIFLYSPNYIIVTGTKIQGINELIISNPSERFANIEFWYMKTKRVWGNSAAKTATSTESSSPKLKQEEQTITDKINAGLKDMIVTSTPKTK